MDLVVGRICTPISHKWPRALVPFYRTLAERCEFVTWEFVGCPHELQAPLREACGHRVKFWEAAWKRRDRYWTWDALLYHHPSLTESFGRTVAEAMRAGCVPVVDRHGGFCEQLDAGGGFLCESLDDFAAALEPLRSPEIRRETAQEAQWLADERWSLEAFAERLRDVLVPKLQLGNEGINAPSRSRDGS